MPHHGVEAGAGGAGGPDLLVQAGVVQRERRPFPERFGEKLVFGVEGTPGFGHRKADRAKGPPARHQGNHHQGVGHHRIRELLLRRDPPFTHQILRIHLPDQQAAGISQHLGDGADHPLRLERMTGELGTQTPLLLGIGVGCLQSPNPVLLVQQVDDARIRQSGDDQPRQLRERPLRVERGAEGLAHLRQKADGRLRAAALGHVARVDEPHGRPGRVPDDPSRNLEDAPRAVAVAEADLVAAKGARPLHVLLEQTLGTLPVVRVKQP